MARVGDVLPLTRPVAQNGLDQFANGLLRGGIGTKIKCARDRRIFSFAREPRAEPEITAQTFEDMLPRTHCRRIADQNRLFFAERADAVRHDAILRVIAAADDIAGADGHYRAKFRVRNEKSLVPRLRDEFGCGLAHGIYIVAT